MKQKRIIFYELNEVPFKIFDHFSNLNPKSSLAKVRHRARSYETFAEDSGHLSPWVTWPSLHRGVNNDNHEISDFGMDLTHVDKDFPPLWKILTQYGVKCGVFGSLHTHPLPTDLSNYSFFVPDTFAAGPECFPQKFEVFQNFNLKMAGLNGRNVNNGIALKEAGEFLLAAPGLGLKGRTAGKILQQLVMERVNKNRVVRRRTAQVQIAFDFFEKAITSEKPDISFFFTNHVASSMHRYWPALFPDDYLLNSYDDKWHEDWSGEIPFVMYETDYQLSQLTKFVENNHDYVLMVGTSMGQAAVDGKERVNTTIIISNLNSFLSGLGFSKEDWVKKPAMAPQYNVQASEKIRSNLIQNLGGLYINGQPIQVTDLGSGVVRIEFQLINQDELYVEYMGQKMNPDAFGIKNIHLQDAAGANAYHIPNGMLMIYDPQSPNSEAETLPQKISTLDIAPAILSNFGLNIPGYMNNNIKL